MNAIEGYLAGLPSAHYSEKVLDRFDLGVGQVVRGTARRTLTRISRTDANRKPVTVEVILTVAVLVVMMVKLEIKPPLLPTLMFAVSVYAARAWLATRRGIRWTATKLAC